MSRERNLSNAGSERKFRGMESSLLPSAGHPHQRLSKPQNSVCQSRRWLVDRCIIEGEMSWEKVGGAVRHCQYCGRSPVVERFRRAAFDTVIVGYPVGPAGVIR